MMIQEFGKIVIILGLTLIVVGLIFLLLGKTPFLGKFPGDVLVKGKNFTFFAPIGSAILISFVLSILLTIFTKLKH